MQRPLKDHMHDYLDKRVRINLVHGETVTTQIKDFMLTDNKILYIIDIRGVLFNWENICYITEARDPYQ